MDSRLFPQKDNLLLQLPKELLDTILGELDYQAAANAVRVNYRFSCTLKPRIAAYLYEEALKERFDRAWIKFRELERFSQVNKQAPWAKYYLGAMRLHGQGRMRDELSGLNLLNQSFRAGDANAARELGTWLLQNNLPENLPWVNLVIPALELAHTRGDARASFVLGKMLTEPSFGTFYNLEKAHECFMRCLEADDVSAIAELGQLIPEPEKKIEFYYQLQNNFIPPTHTRKRAEVYYLRALQYKLLGNEEEYFQQMNLAATLDHPYALYDMGKKSEDSIPDENENDDEDDAYDEALKSYKKGMYLNDPACTQKYMHLLTHPHNDEDIEHGFIQMRMLKAFNKYNASHVAYYMGWYLMAHYTMTNISTSVFYSLWLQLAAQYGDIDTLNHMEDSWLKSEDKPVFYGCALGIIHSLGTPSTAPNKDAATDYFEQVLKKAPYALQEYLRHGLCTGLLDEMVLHALKKMPLIDREIQVILNPSKKKRKIVSI